jgi:two-component system response regulator YesN
MLNVMVVDDEPFVRISIASFKDWNKLGYDFRYEAGNGRQALGILEAHTDIDILILDLAMPTMDGIALLKALPEALGSRQRQYPAVIVLSAHDDFHLVRTAFMLGAQNYLLKSELDGDSLSAVLDSTARGLGEANERREASSENLRVEYQAERFLQGLLDGKAYSDIERDVGEKAARLEFPLTLVAIWIEDQEIVASRYASDEAKSFDELFLRSIRQAVNRRGDGRAVKAARDGAAVFAWPINDPSRLATEIKESLERCLSLRMEVRFSAPVCRLEDVCAAWQALGQMKKVHSRIVVQAKRYLREHLAGPISLQDLADFVGVSRNHLSWDFSRETGETISAHLSRLRVEEACRLLATSSMKVYEIAEEVGYSSVENFNRVFKRVTGSSPTHWVEEAGSDAFRDFGQRIGK